MTLRTASAQDQGSSSATDSSPEPGSCDLTFPRCLSHITPTEGSCTASTCQTRAQHLIGMCPPPQPRALPESQLPVCYDFSSESPRRTHLQGDTRSSVPGVEAWPFASWSPVCHPAAWNTESLTELPPART